MFTATDKTQVASYSAERAYQLVGSVASSAPSGAETELLSIHGLVKRYAEAIAVNELSLTLKRGEVFAFLGPNGAGKTSTIRMLCGLTRPSAGYGTVLGYDIWQDRFQVRSLLGYVPQQFSLYPDLTVLENLWFFASAYRVPRRRANCQIQTLLSQLDLLPVHQKRAGQLSGGFKQLLAIGCALVHKPPLLILDEPTSGLDPTHRQTIWDLLYRLSQEGTTIFVTTHYMDEADRCTKVGFLYEWTALGDRLTESAERSSGYPYPRFRDRTCNPGTSIAPESSGRFWCPPQERTDSSVRSRARCLVNQPPKVLALSGTTLARLPVRCAGYGRCFRSLPQRALAREFAGSGGIMKLFAGQTALVALAVKELLHIWRDRRVVTLILFLPPIFTLLLGHAFEVGPLKDVPAILLDKDRSKESAALVNLLSSKDIFLWRQPKDVEGDNIELSQNKVQAAIIIPSGWGDGLHNGGPIPLQLVLDGADTNSAPEIQGAVQQIVGEFQSRSLETMINDLPEEVFDLGRQLPELVRKNFSSSMSPWAVKSSILYNPDLKFINFAMPGIVGLILQLFTVTLIASSLSRERESGTLFQLQVTPMQKSAIIIGKILPYLGIALVVELVLFTIGEHHFHAESRNPVLLLALSLVFLLSTSGLGALISSFSGTQTQAVQFSVFFLLPVFLLSGAFAPVSQLPFGVRLFSYAFPLTYFCHACREINMYSGDIANVTLDFLLLGLGALVTCSIAALRLRQSEV